VSNSENSPKLLDQVRAKIRLKHYSIRTEQAYTDWIKRYILHFGKRCPRDLGASEVEQFLTHLAVNGKVAAAKKTAKKRGQVFDLWLLPISFMLAKCNPKIVNFLQVTTSNAGRVLQRRPCYCFTLLNRYLFGYRALISVRESIAAFV